MNPSETLPNTAAPNALREPGALPRTETLRGNVARATDRAHEVADRVGMRLHTTADALGRSAERAIYQGDAAATAARRYVNERPLMALGAAFLFGCLVRRLMR